MSSPSRGSIRQTTWSAVNDAARLAQVQAERNFLLARMYGDSEWVGASSDALTHYAITGEPPRREPADWGDYFRCVETYRRAPEHLKPAMRPWLDRWYDFVEARFPGEESDLWHMRNDPVAA